jgi:3-oxoacyl-[acyl-carrier protein] reductase
MEVYSTAMSTAASRVDIIFTAGGDMDLMLVGRTAIVTGAGSGIGASIAECLAAHGCMVYASDLRADHARATAGAIHRQGGEATPVVLDVGNWRQAESVVSAATAERGRLDILVNSAGMLSSGPVMESTIEDWHAVVRVNLSGVFYCSRAVLPTMLRQKYGKIINIASVSAARGGGALGNTLYGTTKAGVVALTKGLARETAASGISVNAIAPGVVDTPMISAQLRNHADVRARIVKRTPAGRLAEPSDIAALAVFLASDACRHVTGATIPVDGGFLTA